VAKPREKKPTDEELTKLRAIFTDSLLMSAHAIIYENVQRAVIDLLDELKRPDLSAVAADWERLLPG